MTHRGKLLAPDLTWAGGRAVGVRLDFLSRCLKFPFPAKDAGAKKIRDEGQRGVCGYFPYRVVSRARSAAGSDILRGDIPPGLDPRCWSAEPSQVEKSRPLRTERTDESASAHTHT